MIVTYIYINAVAFVWSGRIETMALHTSANYWSRMGGKDFV